MVFEVEDEYAAFSLEWFVLKAEKAFKDPESSIKLSWESSHAGLSSNHLLLL